MKKIWQTKILVKIKQLFYGMEKYPVNSGGTKVYRQAFPLLSRQLPYFLFFHDQTAITAMTTAPAIKGAGNNCESLLP